MSLDSVLDLQLSPVLIFPADSYILSDCSAIVLLAVSLLWLGILHFFFQFKSFGCLMPLGVGMVGQFLILQCDQ